MTTQTTVSAPQLNQIELRNAFGQFATGVNVITTVDTDGALIGMTANSFSSVSLDPALLLWCPGNNLPSLPAFKRAGHFTINVLSEEQHDVAMQFARPSEDKFAGVDYSTGVLGAPVINGAAATFQCRIQDLHPAGDHHIMVGEIVAFSTAQALEPLIFHAGQFRGLSQ